MSRGCNPTEAFHHVRCSFPRHQQAVRYQHCLDDLEIHMLHSKRQGGKWMIETSHHPYATVMSHHANLCHTCSFPVSARFPLPFRLQCFQSTAPNCPILTCLESDAACLILAAYNPSVALTRPRRKKRLTSEQVMMHDAQVSTIETLSPRLSQRAIGPASIDHLLVTYDLQEE